MSMKPVLDHTHGVSSNRCGHPDCVTAWRRYKKQWTHNQHRGVAHTVDPEPVRMHIASLFGAGWSGRAIAAAAGVSYTTVHRTAQGTRARIAAPLAAAILAVDPDTTLPRAASANADSVMVPKVGTVRRIRALLAMGWPHHELRARSGVSTESVNRQAGHWVLRETHDAVAAIYRELSHKPGPSEISRANAARRGYAGPLAWDDIDHDHEPDPDESDGCDVVPIEAAYTTRWTLTEAGWAATGERAAGGGPA